MERRNMVKELEALLQKKKKNDENISQELLNTKYKKSYIALKKEICNCVTDVLQSFVFSGTIVKKEDAGAAEFKKKAQAIIDEEAKKGTFNHIRDVAFSTYSFDKIIEAMVPLHNRIIYEAYADYWISKCEPCKSRQYSHYNSLLEMWYDVEAKTWVRVDESGVVSSAIYYPPTKDLMSLEYEEEKAKA